MNDISDDAKSDSGDDTDSGDESQLEIITEEPDDILSGAEVDGQDDSAPIGRLSNSPVSRERFPFTGDTGVKVVLQDPQNPIEICLSFVDRYNGTYSERDKQICCQGL
ncbi:hypothetical protein Hamer_G006492 [Homarus americanus]|uniref:Uncharacterized protein n=1 Tax=Homarus americanus TaxID=6706 RepID=A0A8J5JLG8_HOMAM|nr:hypothetical protein Hamer_G006492 [Homarus americanus]